jgi:hypothetical protein
MTKFWSHTFQQFGIRAVARGAEEEEGCWIAIGAWGLGGSVSEEDAMATGLSDGCFSQAMARKRDLYANVTNDVPLQVIPVLLMNMLFKMFDILILDHDICRHNKLNCALNYSS